MPQFSTKSREKLMTCDMRIQKIMNEAIKYIDFTILEGHRGEELQNMYFEQGKSRLKFPNSKHNKIPSLAIDIAPYPIDWNDREKFYYLAGVIRGIAGSMGIKIRHGGDWNSNNNFRDQTFFDLPHFELVDEN